MNIFVAGAEVWGGVYSSGSLLLGSSVLGSSVLGFSGTVCSSAINRDTQITSLAAWVRAIYSASVEDSATVCCLLLDHDTADRLDSSPGDLSSVRTHTYPPVLF